MTLRRRELLGLAAGGLAALALQAGRRLAAAPLTPAAALPPRGDLRLALISDLNAGYGSTSYVPQVHRGVQLLRDLKPDLVLCAGDMVAGQKSGLSTGQLDAMWVAFARQVLQPLRSSGAGFAPAMGNHDASSLAGPEGFRFALDRDRAARFWRGQKNSLGLTFVEASRFPYRYSLRHGELFALVLEASSARLPAEDWAWAEAQLASPQARTARLRLVMGHLPPYGLSQGRDRAGEVLEQPQRLLQVLERHDVHLLVSGHQHAWFPSRVGQVNLLGLGAMGSGPRRRLQDSRPPVQTLTLLDLDRKQGQLGETTLELNGLAALPASTLPEALQPAVGPRLVRRAGPIHLSTGP